MLPVMLTRVSADFGSSMMIVHPCPHPAHRNVSAPRHCHTSAHRQAAPVPHTPCSAGQRHHIVVPVVAAALVRLGQQPQLVARTELEILGDNEPPRRIGAFLRSRFHSYSGEPGLCAPLVHKDA